MKPELKPTICYNILFANEVNEMISSIRNEYEDLSEEEIEPTIALAIDGAYKHERAEWVAVSLHFKSSIKKMEDNPILIVRVERVGPDRNLYLQWKKVQKFDKNSWFKIVRDKDRAKRIPIYHRWYSVSALNPKAIPNSILKIKPITLDS